MGTLFEPTKKEDFYASVDKGIEQLDAGQGKDAFKSFENITSELEEGYKALQAARLAHEQKAV